jgi:hypothetical protein
VPLVHWNDAFWCGSAILQRAVRPDSVVADESLLDQDLDFDQSLEVFTVQQLVSEPGIEAFETTALSGVNLLRDRQFWLLPL